MKKKVTFGGFASEAEWQKNEDFNAHQRYTDLFEKVFIGLLGDSELGETKDVVGASHKFTNALIDELKKLDEAYEAKRPPADKYSSEV